MSKIRMAGKHGLTRNEALALLGAAGEALERKPPRHLREAEHKLALAIAAFDAPALLRAMPASFAVGRRFPAAAAGAELGSSAPRPRVFHTAAQRSRGDHDGR